MTHAPLRSTPPQALLELHSFGEGWLQDLSREVHLAPRGPLALVDELPLAAGRTGASVLHVCRYSGDAGGESSSSSGGGTPAAGPATGSSERGTWRLVVKEQDHGLLTVYAAEGLEV